MTLTLKLEKLKLEKLIQTKKDTIYIKLEEQEKSKDNDSNQLLFAGFSGNTDLSLIENKKRKRYI